MAALIEFLARLVDVTTQTGSANVLTNPEAWTDGLEITAKGDAGPNRDITVVRLYSGSIVVTAHPNIGHDTWQWHYDWQAVR